MASAIREWYDRAMGGTTHSTAMTRPESHESGGTAVRGGIESVLVGGVMGALEAELPEGLDIKGKAPIDAIAGIAGLITAAAAGGHEMSRDALNVGTVSMGIFSFRKTYALIAAKKALAGAPPPKGSLAKAHGPAAGLPAKPGAKVHGDVGEDPIVAAAKNL